jgi:protein-L-isoaspartate(D-aspartate) O-methyltransferase
MFTTDGVERFAALRREMVRTQLEPRGIEDPRVLEAMASVPRERFVPSGYRHRAYDDCALPIGEGQTISQPYMVARTCELARVRPDARVLEVGCGSGYQAAVLAKLAASVVTMERVEELARGAESVLRELGLTHVEVVVGDGTEGYAPGAPYDAIVVAAGAPRTPEQLALQLAEGGRLVIPLGSRFEQRLTVLRKTRDGLEESLHDGCIFVPLRGAGGWTE